MNRELYAVVEVFEKRENDEIVLLHDNLRLSPEVQYFSTEGGVIYANHWFHLKVTTYEGMEGIDGRNNQ